MEKAVDFKKECIVFIIGKAKDDDKTLRFQYQRSRTISDKGLTEEALSNFDDMKERKLENVDELLAIYIARSQEQYNKLKGIIL